LDHALWALEGGADAVYVGFQKFSARSHANNLSLDDMAALAAAAHAKGARVYCAMNIIVDADETAEAVGLAWELYWRGVSALIIQDLGLALALKRLGPPLKLHASTQAAVHNPGGVAALKAMGFSRVVLAREMTMAEIGQVIRADPLTEYEVFVHGALCYAVSGNCMASGMMIGRSANRGDCGQICRTQFKLDYLIPGPKRRESPHEAGLPEGIHAPPGEKTWKSGTLGTFASMNDLELGARIRELASLGVCSFKIEGRMKPPAYSFNTARAYKAFLKGGNDAEAWSWLDEARVSYGRLPSVGWFDGHKALAQTNPFWAGSLGTPLGVVTGGQGNKIQIAAKAQEKTLRTLARGDGVMVIGTSGQVFRGALAEIAEFAGRTAELHLATEVKFAPQNGTLWLLSRHDGKLPVKKPAKLWRHALAMSAKVIKENTGVQITLSTPEWGGFALTEVVEALPARGSVRLETVLEDIFKASDSTFIPRDFSVDNQAGDLFIPPKLLKNLRRNWYALVEEKARTFVKKIPEMVKAQAADLGSRAVGAKPPRATLSPLTGVNKLVGFVIEWENLTSKDLAPTPWGLALPLAPFTPDETSYLGRFRDFLVRLKAEVPGTPVFPGLSNPCHLTWVRALRLEGFSLPSWFVDWGFHTANPWTPVQLAQSLPGLSFAVPWLEAVGSPDPSYFPPLFTSRACLLRNSFGAASPTPGAFDSREWIQARLDGKKLERPAQGPRCPDGCAGHFSARLLQGQKAFRVEARDCINYLVME
jgi:putative protease